MEQLKSIGFQHTYCVALVADRPYYSGNNNHGIYKYFREHHKVYGRIYQPTGESKNVDYVELEGEYPFKWESLISGMKFYCIEI